MAKIVCYGKCSKTKDVRGHNVRKSVSVVAVGGAPSGHTVHPATGVIILTFPSVLSVFCLRGQGDLDRIKMADPLRESVNGLYGGIVFAPRLAHPINSNPV